MLPFSEDQFAQHHSEQRAGQRDQHRDPGYLFDLSLAYLDLAQGTPRQDETRV